MIKEFYISKSGDKITNLKVMADNLKALPDGRYLVKIEKKGRRTMPQNRYYFGCIVPMIRDGLKDLGHDITLEETHDFLKSKFNLLEIVNTETGEFITVPKSTRRLSTIEFSEYIEKIQRFSAEFLSIVIPSANSQLSFV